MKYDTIILLILGLLVVSLTLYFIFNEYFTSDDLDWEVCRQSIIFRASSPELKKAGTDLKGVLPLKCKTAVVNIDKVKDHEELFEKISNAVAEGWYMFGEGKYDFIHREWTKGGTSCMVFARIHYDSEFWKDFKGNSLLDRATAKKEFIKYYNSNTVGNSRETYEDYLPLFDDEDVSGDGNFDSDGNLYISWDSVDVVPNEDSGDLFLVYRINKLNGLVNLVVGPISRGPQFISFITDKIKKDENYKSLVLTTSDQLKNGIGCDSFLTVPA